jgi:hypothetical protein
MEGRRQEFEIWGQAGLYNYTKCLLVTDEFLKEISFDLHEGFRMSLRPHGWWNMQTWMKQKERWSLLASQGISQSGVPCEIGKTYKIEDYIALVKKAATIMGTIVSDNLEVSFYGGDIRIYDRDLGHHLEVMDGPRSISFACLDPVDSYSYIRFSLCPYPFDRICLIHGGPQWLLDMEMMDSIIPPRAVMTSTNKLDVKIVDGHFVWEEIL